ncbi:hypothetical protein [Paenibacillus sp. S150]|uniref:hypothetical protein n=1 Tax=Paenibacillus sp. S150 TaxID=2749826 RepID=UPI001C5A14CB|nr:hypothetical protein [Paenibacillus sp. S150]MBW4084412.1 hypothetical protein [Paenibacillus sp. S150]
MDWLHDYDDELRLVFQDCSGIISGFPEPLRAQGLSYLDQFNVFSAGSHKNYICYLLPFWLRDGYGLTDAEVRGLSAGNVFFMLYFFIQDDLMDSSKDSAARKLPLANLLYVEFLNRYRPLFPSDSLFWLCFNRYILEWAESVAGEAYGDYFLNDRLKLSHKASPLKLTSTAILLYSGNAALIPEAEDLLHTVLLTLQMLDDYEDWEEDLAEGSYNCLLSMACNHANASQETLTQTQVKDFIFTAGGLAAYAGTALANHMKLADHQLDAPHLISFHQFMVKNLQHMAAAVEAEKQLLQNGGLNYWLSKHLKL